MIQTSSWLWKFRKCRIFAFIIFLGCVFPFGTKGCGLADHHWEKIWSFRVSLPAPILPFSEEEARLHIPPQHGPQKIWWFVSSPTTAFLGVFILVVFRSSRSTQWSIFSFDATPPSLGIEENALPLLLRSDNSALRLVLFRDQQAKGCCWQLVLLQEEYLRTLWTSQNFPIAEERFAQNWLQIIWYGLPIAENILSMSISTAPDRILSLHENPQKVKSLITSGLIKGRKNQIPNPKAPLFPTLEEENTP
ncbi:MAG: hypothetical protein WA705_13960 [Candidatus Ozemobacteraceae bacterium]